MSPPLCFSKTSAIWRTKTNLLIYKKVHLFQSLVIFRPLSKHPELLSNATGRRLHLTTCQIAALTFRLDESLRRRPLATWNSPTAAAAAPTSLLLVVLPISLRTGAHSHRQDLPSNYTTLGLEGEHHGDLPAVDPARTGAEVSEPDGDGNSASARGWWRKG